VGLGQLVLICEVAHNLGADTGAVVAVASTERAADRSLANLHRLVEPDAIPEQALVIAAAPADERRALDRARAIAGALAGQGRDVLWLADRNVWDRAGPELFGKSVGVLPGGGSVTGVRVAPHARDAEAAPAWHEADAETVFGIEPFVAGRLPAVDVLASSSSLIERGLLPKSTIDAARTARRVLEQSAQIQHYLTQPFWVAEEHTGQPGVFVDPSRAVAELATLLCA
jgi:F0F1-type ATP synthase beta subunit